MSNVLELDTNVKEGDVVKHKEQHQRSYKNAASGIPKQTYNATTSESLESVPKGKDNTESISNYNKRVHQRVIDLEDQIKTMKKEHVGMLESLHKEIESLKTRNKGKIN